VVAVRRPLIPGLSPGEAELVSKDIRYLSTAELHRFCDRHEIPYAILMEKADGRLVRSRDRDRKAIVVARVLRFAGEGVIAQATVFRHDVIGSEPPGRPPVASDRVLYGQYKNRDRDTLTLLKSLTGGRFEFGAIAQEVLRTCWSGGEAPTYAQFAVLWQAAVEAHTRPNPEWAFLSDLADGRAGPGWKQFRSRRAAAVIALLERASR
jgi:hypothetical protein